MAIDAFISWLYPSPRPHNRSLDMIATVWSLQRETLQL
jgi:hypothetical protein